MMNFGEPKHWKPPLEPPGALASNSVRKANCARMFLVGSCMVRQTTMPSPTLMVSDMRLHRPGASPKPGDQLPTIWGVLGSEMGWFTKIPLDLWSLTVKAESLQSNSTMTSTRWSPCSTPRSSRMQSAMIPILVHVPQPSNTFTRHSRGSNLPKPHLDYVDLIYLLTNPIFQPTKIFRFSQPFHSLPTLIQRSSQTQDLVKKSWSLPTPRPYLDFFPVIANICY